MFEPTVVPEFVNDNKSNAPHHTIDLYTQESDSSNKKDDFYINSSSRRHLVFGASFPREIEAVT